MLRITSLEPVSQTPRRNILKKGHSVFAFLNPDQQKAIREEANKLIPMIPPNAFITIPRTLKAHGEGWSTRVKANFCRDGSSTKITVVDANNREDIILIFDQSKQTKGQSQAIPDPKQVQPQMQVVA